MKYANTKIEKCVANKRDPRYYLQHVYLDADNARLLSTDGHHLAVLPVELEDQDTSGAVPADAFKAARKRSNLDDKGQCSITINEHCETADGATLPRPDSDFVYPDVDRIIPDRDGDRTEVIINADLLANIQAAITPNELGKQAGVVLSFARGEDGGIAASEAILVLDRQDPDSGALGVLMPMRKD